MLARAKTIIRERYLVVGLTEDLKGFMEILEVLMPKLFRNATTVYKITGLFKWQFTDIFVS